MRRAETIIALAVLYLCAVGLYEVVMLWPAIRAGLFVSGRIWDFANLALPTSANLTIETDPPLPAHPP